MVREPADGAVERGDVHRIRVRIRVGVGTENGAGGEHRVGPHQHDPSGQHPVNRLGHQPQSQVVAPQGFGDEGDVRDQDCLGDDGQSLVLCLDLFGELIAVEQPGQHLVIAVELVQAHGDRVLGAEADHREVE